MSELNRCTNVAENSVVEDALCDSTNKPPNTRSCVVSCPGECVLTEWSEWSPCSKVIFVFFSLTKTRFSDSDLSNCDVYERKCEESRSRQRSIIRNPIYNRTCDSLEEIQTCSRELNNCWTYDWHTSDWGSCLPLGGSQCGEGVQSRALSCVRNDGYSVHFRSVISTIKRCKFLKFLIISFFVCDVVTAIATRSQP